MKEIHLYCEGAFVFDQFHLNYVFDIYSLTFFLLNFLYKIFYCIIIIILEQQACNLLFMVNNKINRCQNKISICFSFSVSTLPFTASVIRKLWYLKYYFYFNYFIVIRILYQRKSMLYFYLLFRIKVQRSMLFIFY